MHLTKNVSWLFLIFFLALSNLTEARRRWCRCPRTKFPTRNPTSRKPTPRPTTKTPTPRPTTHTPTVQPTLSPTLNPAFQNKTKTEYEYEYEATN